MHVSGMDESVENQPLRIDHEMALAALDPLAAIVAALTASLAATGCLAVDDRRMRLRITTGQHPGLRTQGIVNAPPRAALTPSSKMIVTLCHGGTSCGSRRQGSPLRRMSRIAFSTCRR
jgi:hypothetical protein